MRNPTKPEWPEKVEFQVCPHCRRHASFVIDGQEVTEAVISTEGAIRMIVNLMKRRRISYAQARSLAPAIAAARLPALEEDALASLSRAALDDDLMALGEGVVAIIRMTGDRTRRSGEASPGTRPH